MKKSLSRKSWKRDASRMREAGVSRAGMRSPPRVPAVCKKSRAPRSSTPGPGALTSLPSSATTTLLKPSHSQITTRLATLRPRYLSWTGGPPWATNDEHIKQKTRTLLSAPRRRVRRPCHGRRIGAWGLLGSTLVPRTGGQEKGLEMDLGMATVLATTTGGTLITI